MTALTRRGLRAAGPRGGGGGGGAALLYRGRAFKVFNGNTGIAVAQADFDVAPNGGDWLAMIVVSEFDQKAGNDVRLPATGWTLLEHNGDGNGQGMTVATRQAGGSTGAATTDGTYTLVNGSGASLPTAVAIVACAGSGVDGHLETFGSASGNAAVLNQLTGLTGGADILFGMWLETQTGSGTLTVPGSMTSLSSGSAAGLGTCKAVLGKEVLASSAATGTRAAAVTTNLQLYAGALVAMK